MSAALIWIQNHAELVAGLAYATLNVINAMVKGPEAKSLVGKLLDAVSVLTRSEAQGTLKLPGMRSSSVDNAPNGVHHDPPASGG